MVIDMAGVVYAVGHNKSGACGVGSFDDIDQFCPVKLTVSAYKLALGDCFSIIVDTEDNVYTCGHGQYHGHKTN